MSNRGSFPIFPVWGGEPDDPCSSCGGRRDGPPQGVCEQPKFHWKPRRRSKYIVAERDEDSSEEMVGT